jgi:hypothetical protein
MALGDRYGISEAMAIHLVTGLLLLAVSPLFLAFIYAREPRALIAVIPLTLLAGCGCWFQARFFPALLRGRHLDVLE